MRVVIAEDSVLFRAAVVKLLENAGFDVVGQAGDADDLLRKVRAHRPDVAIVDIRMPPTHRDEGVCAAQQIRAELPSVGVLLLSHHVDEGSVAGLLERGVSGAGYLLKDRVLDVAEFTDAVRRVGAGGSAVDPQVVAQVVGDRDRGGALRDLTDPERAVLAELAAGATNRAIARRLFVSERTVERHVAAIFARLRLPDSKQEHRRVLAALAYLKAV